MASEITSIILVKQPPLLFDKGDPSLAGEDSEKLKVCKCLAESGLFEAIFELGLTLRKDSSKLLVCQTLIAGGACKEAVALSFEMDKAKQGEVSAALADIGYIAPIASFV